MIASSVGRTIHRLFVVCIVCSVPWFVWRAKSASASGAADASLPTLRIGEILNYRIDWQHYAGAGVAQLEIVDRKVFYGSQAWHFRAIVHTSQPVRALYPMDDQIDSYALAANLEGREYQEHFREFGKPEDTVAALIAPGETPGTPGPRVIVPVGTRDALGVIYLLRATNWPEQKGLSVPVYDGENVYEMVAKAGEPSKVRVTIGSYQATEIAIRFLDGQKEIPDEHFRIWLADDDARTPLLCEAELPIGKVRIELMSGSAYQVRTSKPLTLPERSNHPAGN